MKIILRPHPGDLRTFDKLPAGIALSDSKKEDSFKFLTQIDALLAGESSIHLEAVLMNVFPLYYTFTPNSRHDYYGYIRNGLAEYYEDISSLKDKILDLVKKKPFIQERARFFNSAIGTESYGNTSKEISNLIVKSSLSN